MPLSCEFVGRFTLTSYPIPQRFAAGSFPIPFSNWTWFCWMCILGAETACLMGIPNSRTLRMAWSADETILVPPADPAVKNGVSFFRMIEGCDYSLLTVENEIERKRAFEKTQSLISIRPDGVVKYAISGSLVIYVLPTVISKDCFSASYSRQDYFAPAALTKFVCEFFLCHFFGLTQLVIAQFGIIPTNDERP